MAGLIIHEVFAAGSAPGGQQSGVPAFQHDYVVLHNTSNSAIDLSGFALQTINGTGSGTWSVLNLTGSVPAYGYYLVQLGTTASTLGGDPLPVTPDATAADAMALGPNSAKIAITNTTAALSGAVSSGGTIVDMVGFGTQANAREGSSSANNAPSPTNTLAIVRNATDGWDTNINSADFATATPDPKNSGSSPLNATPSITSAATADVLENATGTVIDVNATDPEGDTENGGGLTYSIVANANDDSALFTIDSATGALSFITPPDAQAGTGSGANANQYVLRVRVLDSGGTLAASSEQDITINVQETSGISTPVDTNSAINRIKENATGLVGITANATPVDTSGATVTYSLVTNLGGATAYAGPFAIDAATGVVSLTRPLDFETAGSSFDLFVKATATGGSAAVSQFTVALLDVSPEVRTGTADADRLNGGSDKDVLRGLAGNDVMTGQAGIDVLLGGLGRDVMGGGTEADTFDFNGLSEMGKTSTTRDRIMDFETGVDKIDLSGIDAQTVVAGNQVFTFLAAKGAAFTGVKGQLHWYQIDAVNPASDKTIVEGDVNGDKVADFQIELTGLKALVKADFVL